MTSKQKTHGSSLAAFRAFVENDPLLREVDAQMIARAALFVAGIFVGLFALKGWVVTWM